MLMANPHHAIKQRRKTSTAPVWFAPLFATDGGILTGSSVSLFSGCPLTSGDPLHAAQRNLSSSLPLYQIINESIFLTHPSPVWVRDFGEGGISLRLRTAAGAATRASHRRSGVTRGSLILTHPSLVWCGISTKAVSRFAGVLLRDRQQGRHAVCRESSRAELSGYPDRWLDKSLQLVSSSLYLSMRLRRGILLEREPICCPGSGRHPFQLKWSPICLKQNKTIRPNR